MTPIASSVAAPAVALCADAESIHRPELIGLAGENLGRQGWLRLFSSGEEARRSLRGDFGVREAWVVGCDDVEPINLAAALKRDRADMRVCLLAFQGTGSLMSRATAAGIDASLSRQAFTERYAEEKRRHTAAGFPTAWAGRATSPGEPAGVVRGPMREVRAEARGQMRDTGAPGGAAAEGLRAEGAFGGVPRRSETASSALRGAADGGRAASVGRWPACSEGSAGGAPAGGGSPACSADAAAFAGGPGSFDGLGWGASRSAARFSQAPSGFDAPRSAGGPAFMLPVVSGSGGAGKSTVAALCAFFAQGLGYKTLLLDFDLRFGDLRELAGAPDALAVDEVLAAPERLARLAPDGLAPAVLAAPKRLEDAEAVVREAPRLLDELQARFDVVVANTGASWAEEHALLLERCSKALFLVDQRPSSLRACRHALDVCSRCGIATGPFLFAANRCAKGAPLTSIDVSCALRGASAVELREGGRDVEELMGSGQPLDLIAAKNDLCTSLEHVLVDLLPGCEGRTLSIAEPEGGRGERRFGRIRRRGRRGAPCPC